MELGTRAEMNQR